MSFKMVGSQNGPLILISTLYRYAVTVMARNHVSNATSEPVELVIQQPIDRLSVIMTGTRDPISKSCCSALVGQEIEISTQQYSGSHMFFQWDFGDGSDVVSGTSLYVYHAYNRLVDQDVYSCHSDHRSISQSKNTVCTF